MFFRFYKKKRRKMSVLCDHLSLGARHVVLTTEHKSSSAQACTTTSPVQATQPGPPQREECWEITTLPAIVIPARVSNDAERYRTRLLPPGGGSGEPPERYKAAAQGHSRKK